MKDLHILICGHHPKYYKFAGGPTIQTGKFAELLAERVDTILLIPGDKYKETYEKKMKIVIMGGKSNKRLSFNYFKHARKLKREYNIIHFIHPAVAYLFQKFNFFLRKKTVLTFHGYSSLEYLISKKTKKKPFKYRLIRMMEKNAVKNANAIVAVGEELKDWIIHELKADPNKVFHIP
ncbi:MAG: glycosyltransferase, partial [Candidatus Thorarchaeota archaeon]